MLEQFFVAIVTVSDVVVLLLQLCCSNLLLVNWEIKLVKNGL